MRTFSIQFTDALTVSPLRYFIRYYLKMITLESWTTSLHSFCIDILLLYIDSFLRHLAIRPQNQPRPSATSWSLPIVWLARKAPLFMGTAMVQIVMCWESIVNKHTYLCYIFGNFGIHVASGNVFVYWNTDYRISGEMYQVAVCSCSLHFVCVIACYVLIKWTHLYFWARTFFEWNPFGNPLENCKE